MKKQLITTLIASTFSLGAHAVGINFDGSNVYNCGLVQISNTYECSNSATDTSNNIYIASGYTVDMNQGGAGSITGSGKLSAASVILGATAILKGDLYSTSTVALGADATIEGDVEAGTTVSLGDGAEVTGSGRGDVAINAE